MRRFYNNNNNNNNSNNNNNNCIPMRVHSKATRLVRFCSVMQFIPLLLLESKLTIGYLDDLTLAGSLCQVSDDVCRVRDVGQSKGLVLNVRKCEVILNSNFCVDESFLSSFQHVSPKDATLLGPHYHKVKH